MSRSTSPARQAGRSKPNYSIPVSPSSGDGGRSGRERLRGPSAGSSHLRGEQATQRPESVWARQIVDEALELAEVDIDLGVKSHRVTWKVMTAQIHPSIACGPDDPLLQPWTQYDNPVIPLCILQEPEALLMLRVPVIGMVLSLPRAWPARRGSLSPRPYYTM